MERVCSVPVPVAAKSDQNSIQPLPAAGRRSYPRRGAGVEGPGAAQGHRVGAATAVLSLTRTTTEFGGGGPGRRLPEAALAAGSAPTERLPVPGVAPTRPPSQLSSAPGPAFSAPPTALETFPRQAQGRGPTALRGAKSCGLAFRRRRLLGAVTAGGNGAGLCVTGAAQGTHDQYRKRKDDSHDDDWQFAGTVAQPRRDYDSAISRRARCDAVLRGCTNADGFSFAFDPLV